jgi:hypothetical protein
MATAQKDKFENFGPQSAGVAQQTKDMASEVGTKAKDMASDAANKAKDLASSVAQKTSDAASFLGQKAQDASTAVGSGMKNLAGTIREHTPATGPLGTASTAVADTLESSGRYLQTHGLSGIGDDLTNLIRRNPIPALFCGIAVGFLISRATSRS